MQTEYDDNVFEFCKWPNGNIIVKLEKNDVLDCDDDVKNTLTSHLWAFILNNSKRIMENFIREISSFNNTSIYYTDTDSLYIEKIIGMF